MADRTTLVLTLAVGASTAVGCLFGDKPNDDKGPIDDTDDTDIIDTDAMYFDTDRMLGCGDAFTWDSGSDSDTDDDSDDVTWWDCCDVWIDRCYAHGDTGCDWICNG